MVDGLKVSVIIPTFNRVQDVQRALNSALAQTYRELEIIVVDDGSTDGTAEGLSRYQDQVRYVRIPHCGLPSKARNAGLEMARGDYLAFLDSDDEWLPQKLERQIAILDSCPDVGLVCSNALVLENRQGKPERPYLRADQGRSGSVLKELLNDNFVITSTAVVRRRLLDRAGSFSEEPLLVAIEDYDLWLRIAAIAKVHYIPDGLAIYGEYSDSLRRKQLSSAYWQGMVLALDRISSYLSDLGYENSLPIDVVKERLSFCRGTLCDAYRAEHRYFDLAKAWSLFVCQQPEAALAFTFGKISRVKQYVAEKAKRQVSRLIGSGRTPDRHILRLHLGCGEVYLPGYTNIDLASEHHTIQRQARADVFADVTQLNYPSGSVDEIRLHHVFEHFDRHTAVRLLIDWYVWLKEGGKLVIETPDFERSARAVMNHRQVHDQLKVLRHIFGSHEAAWAVHKDGWYQAKFELYLGALGYGDLFFSRSEWQGTYNITVTATKVRPTKTREQLLKAAADILRLSLIDDSESEQRIFGVWLDWLRDRRQS